MMNDRNIQKQRRQAVTTAWVLALTALVIFVMFILSGVLGEQ